MKRILILIICGIILGACALLSESDEVKMLRLQQQHELQMKQLEIREKQTSDERLQDDIMESIRKFLNGVSESLSK